MCFVAPLPPPYGGIAHWLTLILGHARAIGVDGWFIIDTAPRWRSVTKRNLLVRVMGGGAQLVRDAITFFGVLRTENIDVVHLTSSGSIGVVRDWLISSISSACGKPLIYHVHHGKIPAVVENGSLEWRLTRKVMLRAAKVILLDIASMRALREAAPDIDSIVVPNCVAHGQMPERAEEQNQDVKTVLFLGWVVPTKGISELLESWSRLQPKGWKLDLVGPVEEAYRDYLLRKFPSSSVFFEGELPHDDAMRRMSGCDLFVLPSHTEGFPNVVLEAMALARPIIASSVGAIPEMLGDGAGVLVDAGSVDSLATALGSVMRDDSLRSRMGLVGRKKARECYGVDIVFHAYLSIWRAACK